MTKQPYGRINIKKLAKSIVNGKTKLEAGIEAGSKANTDPAIINTVNKSMKKDEFKKETKPYIKELEKERKRAMEALQTMSPSTIDYDKLIKAMESMTKQIQLLTGEATEINKVDLSEVKDFLKRA